MTIAIPRQANILVIIVARIGDTLLVTPALRALKRAYPDCKLNVYAHPKRYEILKNLDFIDALAPIEKRRAFWKGRLLTKDRFDLAIVYGTDDELANYAARTSKQVIKLCTKNNNINIHCLKQTEKNIHAVNERLFLLSPLKIQTNNFKLAYTVSSQEHKYAKNWLSTNIPKHSPFLIGIQTQSFHTKPQRNWPIDSFITLLKKIKRILPSSHFILLGDKITEQYNLPVLKKLQQCVSMAAGKMSLRESCAIMSHLDMYIGVDTGPTHIAGALGLPMIVLYHSDFPGHNLIPLQHNNCHYLQSPKNAALSTISTQDVFMEFKKLLYKLQGNHEA